MDSRHGLGAGPVVAALTATLFAVAATAQTCASCAGTGELPCRACAVERDCAFCSVATACSRCRGALATACPDCRAGAAAVATRATAAAAERDAFRTALLAAGVDGTDLLRCRTAHFELLAAPGRVGALADPHTVLHRCADWLETMRARLLEQVGNPAPPLGPCRVVLVRDARLARRLTAAWTGREAQGLGGSGGDPTTVVLQMEAASSEAGLRRLLAHHTAHRLLAGHRLQERGYGWLDVGLAHWLEADQGEGRCEHFCLQGRPQPPRQFHGGDWRAGARTLLDQGRLPTLTTLLASESDRFDFVLHAHALLLVDFLLAQASAPVTHGGKTPPPPLVQLLAGGIERPAAVVLPELLGKDLAAIELAMQDFLRTRGPSR
jgi:hypothetical protein